MLKLAKRENNFFFKLMVMGVIASFMVTSVPEYSWAHLSGVVLTDFISCQKIVGDLYRLPRQSKLISPAFFMEQINNENLRKEIKQAVNFTYINRNMSGENNKLFDTRMYLKGINERIYETAEESSKIIAGFCQSHLNGINNFFNLKFKDNTLLRYIKLVFFSSNLSVNIWEENVIMLKKLGLPVNAVTILFMGRIFLWSSRNVLQTRKKIATRKKNRIKYKTKIKKWKNKFCLSKFAGMNLSNSNSESRHTVNLPQGVRGSPAGNFYRNRRKRTSLRKEISNLDTDDEEEANNSLFVHSFKIFLQTEQTLEILKSCLLFEIIHLPLKIKLSDFLCTYRAFLVGVWQNSVRQSKLCLDSLNSSIFIIKIISQIMSTYIEVESIRTKISTKSELFIKCSDLVLIFNIRYKINYLFLTGGWKCL